MPKHKMKNRTKKICQKGGVWYNPMSWFNKDDQQTNMYSSQYPTSSNNTLTGVVNTVTDAASGAVTSVTDAASGAVASVTDALGFESDTTPSQYTIQQQQPIQQQPIQPQIQQQVQYPTQGGKHKKRGGSKNGLALTYYATPVSGLAVAKPTYWIGGTKSRRCRRTRHKRITRKRITRKRTRH